MGMVEGKVTYGPQVNKNIIIVLVEKHLEKQIYFFQCHILPQTIPINNKEVAFLIIHPLKILCIKLSKANLLNLLPSPPVPPTQPWKLDLDPLGISSSLWTSPSSQPWRNSEQKALSDGICEDCKQSLCWAPIFADVILAGASEGRSAEVTNISPERKQSCCTQLPK